VAVLDQPNAIQYTQFYLLIIGGVVALGFAVAAESLLKWYWPAENGGGEDAPPQATGDRGAESGEEEPAAGGDGEQGGGEDAPPQATGDRG